MLMFIAYMAPVDERYFDLAQNRSQTAPAVASSTAKTKLVRPIGALCLSDQANGADQHVESHCKD